MNIPEQTNASPQPARGEGRRFIILGLVMLWIASLAFVLEILNLAVFKKFQTIGDPSLEITLAAFFLLLSVLGALLIWRGERERDRGPNDGKGRILDIATLLTLVALAIDSCAGGLVFSANRTFLAEEAQKTYIREAPQPGSSLMVFPTPAASQPTPTFDPSGKYLAGYIVGSIDHLRVGDIWISAAPDDQSIKYIQLTIQPVECTVLQDGAPATFAVQNSQPLINGPLPVQNGGFYASQSTGVVRGVVVSPDEIMGTLYLRYADPQTGRNCDLGTFEWDAFVTESGKR